MDGKSPAFWPYYWQEASRYLTGLFFMFFSEPSLIKTSYHTSGKNKAGMI
jgi:hypothetical protein